MRFVLLTVALAACSGGYDVRLSFVDAETKDRAERLQVAVVDDCSTQPLGAAPVGAVSFVEFRVGEPATAIGDIEPGSYGLYARASDVDCNVIAAGCTPIELVGGAQAVLSVQLSDVIPSGLCESNLVCRDGQCSQLGADGGTEGGQDAPITDAALDGDAPNPDGGLVDAPIDVPPVDAGPVEGVPVPLSSLVEAVDTIVITFDRNITIEGPAGFTIRGSEGQTVVSANASGSTLSLQLSADLVYGHNAVTWSYDESTGQVQNLRSLDLIHIDNRLPEPPVGGIEYFVSATGRDTNTGRSEDSPWDIEEAIRRVGPGDKVWLRAGDYGAQEIRFDVDGTATDRIWFEGYKTSTDGVPNPITSLYYTDPTPGGALDSSELPVFTGLNPNEDIAFDIRGLAYVTFRNLAFTNYRVAFYAGEEPPPGVAIPPSFVYHLIFERILGTNFGGTSGSGSLFLLGQRDLNQFITIRGCSGQDADGIFVLLGGRGSLLADSTSWGLRTDGVDRQQTNYFIVKGSENVMRGNLAYSVVETIRPTHGFVLPGTLPERTEYNLMQDNTAINISFAYEFTNESSGYNVARDSSATVEGARGLDKTSAVAFFGGNHHNVVEGLSTRGVSNPIRFNSHRDSSVNSCGHDNLVRNSEFSAISEGVIIAEANGTNPEVTNNRIIGCTFHGFGYFMRLFPVSGPSGVTAVGNEIANCSISQGSYFKHPETIADGGFTFRSNNMYQASQEDDGFDLIVGTLGNISAEPLYIGGSTFDFRLMEGSGNIDQGMDRDDLVFDMRGNERPQDGMNDIGAHER